MRAPRLSGGRSRQDQREEEGRPTKKNILADWGRQTLPSPQKRLYHSSIKRIRRLSNLQGKPVDSPLPPAVSRPGDPPPPPFPPLSPLHFCLSRHPSLTPLSSRSPPPPPLLPLSSSFLPPSPPLLSLSFSPFLLPLVSPSPSSLLSLSLLSDSLPLSPPIPFFSNFNGMLGLGHRVTPLTQERRGFFPPALAPGTLRRLPGRVI